MLVTSWMKVTLRHSQATGFHRLHLGMQDQADGVNHGAGSLLDHEPGMMP